MVGAKLNFKRGICEDLAEKPVSGQRGGESEWDATGCLEKLLFRLMEETRAKGLKQNLFVVFKEQHN